MVAPMVGLRSQPQGVDPFTQVNTFIQGLTQTFATAVQPIADAQADVARKKQDAQRKEG